MINGDKLRITAADAWKPPAQKGDHIQFSKPMLLCKFCQRGFHLAEGSSRQGSSSLGICEDCTETRAKRMAER